MRYGRHPNERQPGEQGCISSTGWPVFVAIVVIDLGAELSPALTVKPDGDLILFDGHCVLCSGLFHWVVRRDRAGHFRFATAQSPAGWRIYQDLGLNPDDLQTMVAIVGGRAYLRLDAVAQIAAHLPGGWRGLALLRYLPRWIKDPAYALVAQNRYRLFGRTEHCLMPTTELQGRFIPQGFTTFAQNSGTQ